MVTACATATVNNIPLLVFPADTFASRQPDPVLQQLEQSSSLAVSTNDAFKPVCKYWDRITRPEMVMTALINAMRVLTDPAETGACCIALCQDVEGESFDFPEYFFKKRVHRITRPVAVEEAVSYTHLDVYKRQQPEQQIFLLRRKLPRQQSISAHMWRGSMMWESVVCTDSFPGWIPSRRLTVWLR